MLEHKILNSACFDMPGRPTTLLCWSMLLYQVVLLSVIARWFRSRSKDIMLAAFKYSRFLVLYFSKEYCSFPLHFIKTIVLLFALVWKSTISDMMHLVMLFPHVRSKFWYWLPRKGQRCL